MDPQKQREIASKGGKAAHQKGTAHEFTSEEARIAGRKGGAASRAKRSAPSESNGGTQPGNQREETAQPESEGGNPM
jgi:general stress protein YciG